MRCTWPCPIECFMLHPPRSDDITQGRIYYLRPENHCVLPNLILTVHLTSRKLHVGISALSLLHAKLEIHVLATLHIEYEATGAAIPEVRCFIERGDRQKLEWASHFGRLNTRFS